MRYPNTASNIASIARSGRLCWRIDDSGVITIRYNSQLHHIGIGRGHKNTRVKILIHDRHIRVITAETGTLLRELILDPTRNYQPQKQP